MRARGVLFLLLCGRFRSDRFLTRSDLTPSEYVEVAAGLDLAAAAHLHVEDPVEEAEHAPAHLLPAARAVRRPARGVEEVEQHVTLIVTGLQP